MFLLHLFCLVLFAEAAFYKKHNNDVITVGEILSTQHNISSMVTCSLRCEKHPQCTWVKHSHGECTLYADTGTRYIVSAGVTSQKLSGIKMTDMLAQAEEARNFNESKLTAKSVCKCVHLGSACKYFASCPGNTPNWLHTAKPSSYGIANLQLPAEFRGFAACAWVKYQSSSASTNEAHYIFSYSEPSDKDCGDIALYGVTQQDGTLRLNARILGEDVLTEIALQQAFYYHLCFQWEKSGDLNIYVNAKQLVRRSNVKKGSIVKGGGYFRVGIGTLPYVNNPKCNRVDYRTTLNGALARVYFVPFKHNDFESPFYLCTTKSVSQRSYVTWSEQAISLAGVATWSNTCAV